MASTAYVAQTDDLNNIFLGLRSKSNDVRAKSALDLRRYVANRVSEMTPDASAKIWNDTINRNLFDLMHSQNNSDRFGGLLAIGASHTTLNVAHANECTDQLLYVDTEESRRHRFRFYNYVRHQLPNHDINLMLAASKTLGRIALTGGSLFGDRFMEKEVPDAIELLQPDKQESPRYAGVLILKELAKNSRPAFAAHVSVVLDNILLPMRDPRVIVREGAADLLAICLDIVTDRDKKSPLLQKVLQDAQLGLKHSQPEVIHGSLLTYRELFLYGKMFMKDSFMDSAETILRFKSHRDALVRRAVIALIPTLAGYDTAMFIEHFLHKSMGHLLTQLDKPSERSYAFIAIGHTAASVHGDMKPFLEQIMLNVKSCLLMRGKKNATSEEPVLQCVGMLSTAVGPNLTKLLHDQLDLMFACGLSKALKTCLTETAKAIPPLLKTIQDRLLDMLSHILSGQPYKPLGAPSSLSREPHVMAREISTTQVNDQNIERIQLALETLSEFDFTGHVLNEFVRNCALPYMESDNVNIRRAAADTCCQLFIRDPICYQASSHAIEVISDVLDKLLTVGVADPVASIRHAVLKSLNDRFDKHLAQAENVRSLFIALNDEEFDNRLAAVNLIGRLAKHNPAYVMPSLRKAFIQLLTELEFSTVTRNREECTRLLTQLVIATSRLIKPYALSMLHALLPKASDNAPTIATNVLMCLGELCVVAGEDALPKVPDLMQVILPRLSDPSTVKRDAALHTLGQICSHTSYVIAPLVDYPQLLPMLGRILRTEQSTDVKRQVVKVLGRLGALDPFRRKSKTQEEAANETVMTTVSAAVAAQNTAAVGTEDYFQTVVITALLAILKDPALSGHHHTVIEAIMSIFKTQGLKCAVFLPQIIPAFSHVAKTSTVRMQEFHLQQLAILVGIIKQHVRNHMVGMYSLINEMWDSDNPALQLPVMTLIEALGSALDAEAKPFLASVIPPILNVFDGELTDKRMNTQMKICDVFVSFGSNIEEYLQLVIPMIVRTYERPDASPQLRKKAIHTIELLSARVNFSDHASRIIHPLVRVLDTAGNDIRQTALDALCAFVYQLGSDFAIFVSTIQKVMAKHRISHPKYEGLITKLLNGERLVQEGVEASDNNRPPEYSAPAEATKLTVNQQHLKQAWDVSHVSTKDEWLEWMHHLEVEFMKESPSHALRACMSLVDIHPPLAKELFNAAFLSCWGELYDQYQEDLVRSIEYAITSNTTPGELVHRLLELAEFMEHEDKPLPIEHRTLGEQAMKYYAFAKALHYKELEFFSESSPAIIESLIAINTRLHQHDAAWGTLITAGEQYDVTKHEEWYERLGRWQEALTVYEKKAELNPGSQPIAIGKMKCLHALGEWDQLAAIVEDHWGIANLEERREIAPMAAAAAWSLREWDAMEDYINTMREGAPDRFFYRAILAVHQNQFAAAKRFIGYARDHIETELSAFVWEGYGRSYNVMVRAQMLSELEEIIVYKQLADQPDRQLAIRKTWMKRLRGCQPDVEVWQRILQVRTLVLGPEDDPVMWIKFANLCRKSGRMVLAEKTINSLLTPEKAPPEVVYAQLKYMWATGAKTESLDFVRHFVASLSKDISLDPDDDINSNLPPTKLQELRALVARCYFKQGQWQRDLSDGWDENNIEDILSSFYLATRYDPTWYKAWHVWALSNFEVIGFMEGLESRSGSTRGTGLAAHVVQAVEGFFRSISLRNEDALQDTLRLLTLWFKYGAHDEVSHAMGTGFTTVEVDTWLEVIPQIIARIQTPHINIRRNINSLLTDVGKHHPQALIYALTVASKSSSKSRRDAAVAIMDRMREHSANIVTQALLVSRELIRVAILWHELWHEGLEEASRLYFTENNPEGMIMALEPLHDMIEAGPSTARETSFVQVFGRELKEARDACRRYHKYGDTAELDKAWDIYYGVFKKVEKQLPQLTTLDLQYVSPALLKARNLELAVPGTYQSGRPIVTILLFSPKLTVISSKQRPRRLSLVGSDGKDYHYILKGHEDLRQDERVMQLFSLVNTLLSADTDSFKRRLHIQRYSVIPLAPNAGLIGWVQDSDTLHVLVRDYRESRKVLLNIEYRLMLQMAPDYESLILLQKVEVFEYALENTTGQDLYRVLWLKSTNSEHWLERRATYTRSLAVNSMVGHILGLGDRHPSNLLLERASGKVVHIDFGDCFEVAMHREKFPEKVPFRLTRMLTHAMEVSGIEGSFRKSCEISMQVLRDNKESLMAVLEAFVYDPLINWRLVQADGDVRRQDETDPDRAAELARVTAHPQGPSRKLKADESDIFNETMGGIGAQEVRNERALAVYSRVQHKLTGRDFNPEVALTVPAQVEKLILQATSLENLCQCFSGWCAFW